MHCCPPRARCGGLRGRLLSHSLSEPGRRGCWPPPEPKYRWAAMAPPGWRRERALSAARADRALICRRCSALRAGGRAPVARSGARAPSPARGRSAGPATEPASSSSQVLLQEHDSAPCQGARNSGLHSRRRSARAGATLCSIFCRGALDRRRPAARSGGRSRWPPQRTARHGARAGGAKLRTRWSLLPANTG